MPPTSIATNDDEKKLPPHDLLDTMTRADLLERNRRDSRGFVGVTDRRPILQDKSFVGKNVADGAYLDPEKGAAGVDG